MVVGLLALQYLINTWWPFDTARIDLVRETATGSIDAATLLNASNFELLAAFLAAILIAVAGFTLPIAYLANERFNHFANRRFGHSSTPQFFVALRQATSVGILAAFSVWLQMLRSLGIAIVLLVATVLIMFELLLQVRSRTPTLNIREQTPA